MMPIDDAPMMAPRAMTTGQPMNGPAIRRSPPTPMTTLSQVTRSTM